MRHGRKNRRGEGSDWGKAYRETIMRIEECVKARFRHPSVPVCSLLYRLIRHIYVPKPHFSSAVPLHTWETGGVDEKDGWKKHTEPDVKPYPRLFPLVQIPAFSTAYI